MKIETVEKNERRIVIPDEIIHLCLSYLDARTVVQTCIVSSEWQHIWCTLPFLNFRKSNFNSVVSYRKFVDDFMTHRKRKSNTNVTSIVIDLKYFPIPEVERVFHFAIDHKVQNMKMFNLGFDGDVNFEFALNFEFLKSLGLRESYVSLNNWNCPVLQTLLLDESNEYILDLQRFPRLEKLTLQYIDTVVVQIRSNTISELSLSQVFLDDLCIWCPNLSSFKFSSHLVPKVRFPDGLPYLESAEIDVCRDKVVRKRGFKHHDRDLKVKEIFDLLNQMKETESLVLSQNTVEVLADASDLSDYQSPSFHRLRSVNLPRKLPTKDESNSPDQVIRLFVNGSPGANILVQDRWMRIRQFKPEENVLVRDDLGGYSVLTSMESIASRKHVQVQSYIKKRESEFAKREAELSCREAEIARQEARLKMERKNLEKGSVWMGTACSLDNQDEALPITEAKSKKDTFETPALSAKTSTTVNEMSGHVNTSSFPSALEKMEEKERSVSTRANCCLHKLNFPVQQH